MRYKQQLWYHAAFAFFCALLIVSVSFAWLAQNHRTDTENQKIKIEPMGITINNYEAYKYNMETNRVDKLTEGIELNMTAYDSIFTERNVNTPLLLVVRLRDIQADRPVTLNVTVRCAPGHSFATDNPNEDDYTSNIVNMKAASAAMAGIEIDEDADEAEWETFFRSVCNYFNARPANSQTDKQFLTVTDNVWTKDNEVTLTIPNVTPDNHAATVYLIIDYDVELVTAQDIVDFGNISLINGNRVSFANDIESIIFSYA